MTGTCHIAVAMKPLSGSFTQNALKHGVSGLNIDGCRVQTSGRPLRMIDAKDTNNTAYAGRMNGSLAGGSKAMGTTSQGRWPANVILGHTEACWDKNCVPECPIRLLGEQSGEAMGFSGGGIRKVKSDIMPSIQVDKGDAEPNYYGDMGTAARYFKQVNEFVEPSKRRTV